MKAECRMREKQQETSASLIAEESKATNFFMVCSSTGVHQNPVWLIDSGCSNHMTGDKCMFSDLDETLRVSVRLGDNKEMDVHGVGTVTMHTKTGSLKKLHGVQYVPGLAHNLLSVGQLLTKEYSIKF